MPETAADPAPSGRRLALPLTIGFTLYGWAHYVLNLPGAFDGDQGTFSTWALATQWLLTNAGLVLALVCGYRLARRLSAHLISRDQAPQPEQPTPTTPRRRSPAIALIAGGAALSALFDLPWVFGGPDTVTTSGALAIVAGLVAVLASVLVPAMIVLGVYLALRQLEDHLAGYHRRRAPKAPAAGGGPHASGLTRPYVITLIIG